VISLELFKDEYPASRGDRQHRIPTQLRFLAWQRNQQEKFFKNNLHHNQNALLFGTELEGRSTTPNGAASYAGMHDQLP
jgi:hypothetical protein